MRERRTKPRIQVAFPALVRGRDSAGKFEEDARIDNLSAIGLYLRTKRRVALGSSLFVTLRFTAQPSFQIAAPILATRGTVVRTDVKPDGTFNLAVKLDRYRFLDNSKVPHQALIQVPHTSIDTMLSR